MMSQPCWASSTQLVHSKNSRGMTLLHLAAAQGYAGLIQTLIRWRWVTNNHSRPFRGARRLTCPFLLCSTKHADSIDLELEVDPLNVDHFSCTPLVSGPYFVMQSSVHVLVCVTTSHWSLQMWACALGHTDAALVLYQWDPRALAIPDSLGRLPLNIARSRGHTRLAELLEQLQQSPQAPSQPVDTWMDRWRGGSEISRINNSHPSNSNSGGRDRQSTVQYVLGPDIFYFLQECEFEFLLNIHSDLLNIFPNLQNA